MPLLAILDQLHDLLGHRFEHITGATLSGEIPVSDVVVNRVLADRLARGDGPVTKVHVQAQVDDQFVAHVTLRNRFVPPLKVPIRIEQQPMMPERPVLSLRWTLPIIGALAALAGPFLANVKTPPGVRLEGDRVIVDIRHVLELYRFDELIPYVSDLQVHTGPGVFVLRFAMRV